MGVRLAMKRVAGSTPGRSWRGCVTTPDKLLIHRSVGDDILRLGRYPLVWHHPGHVLYRLEWSMVPG